jgi:hypothetical protein
MVEADIRPTHVKDCAIKVSQGKKPFREEEWVAAWVEYWVSDLPASGPSHITLFLGVGRRGDVYILPINIYTIQGNAEII